MLSITKSMVITGLDGQLVSVQVDVSSGLPYFEIVGLPDTTVRESKERVRIAIKNSGYDLYSKRIIINLAPANMKKMGTMFDLPIAVGILSSVGAIKSQKLNDFAIIGELSLDGKIKRIKETLAICIEMRKTGIKNLIIPYENMNEVRFLKDLNIYIASNLKEVVDFFNGKNNLKRVEANDYNEYKKEKINNIDFSDVYGQENVKRMLEISAAGGHNCLMCGAPGCGKTMLAERITTILPDLSLEEALEISKMNSLYGDDICGLAFNRPFRMPHYTISESGLIGGGDVPRPGEVTLANNGVLFLDELPEFKTHILETLRVPIENRKVTISRVRAKITYPANFILIAAMNPCPCGYYGSGIKECKCDLKSRNRYMQRVSGPLLDRFDLFIEVNYVKTSKLKNRSEANSSEIIRERVNYARKVQMKRYEKLGFTTNSELSGKYIEMFCKLDDRSKVLLDTFYEKNKISVRSYNKILKVARTIADLEQKTNIEYKHIAEALQYRR